MTDLAQFTDLLRRSMGLDAVSIGVAAIERAVQDRQNACGFADLAAYWQLVCGSGAELQALTEAVVVPETWFFRDREAFAALARMAQDRWQRVRPGGLLRLLSLPCSTGEEPSSMAMALLDAGIPPAHFQIDAVDISARVLAIARRGLYGRNSFRGGDMTFRDRHFTITPGGAQLHEAVRGRVRFQQGNLFTSGFLPGTALYDVIFCRNLLIYFDHDTQDRSVRLLQRLLAPDGTLFVAPSETGLLLSHDFTSVRVPLAFAFHRSAAIPQPVMGAPALRIRPPPIGRPFAKPTRPVSVTTAATPAVNAIEAATLLADQGRLAEAAAACEDHLRRHGASAQAFYLMGLIHDASGDLADAERDYRKALYLDQGHRAALTHLALLLERQGDLAAACLMRRRAARASVP
jgi:chemotaxis protein methyltransferase WspC